MGFQKVFSRYESKYIITKEQYARVLTALSPYLIPDEFGKSTIRNIYFDTDTYYLIRRSLEKPVYKEKLRIRSYRTVGKRDAVFVELKKKFKGVVYKRRVSLCEEDAMGWITQGTPRGGGQIEKEIDYTIARYHPLTPKVFLSYDRVAYYAKADRTMRITFDEAILARLHDLSLMLPPGGEAVLPPKMVLMEVKCIGAMPLWLTGILTEEKIFKTSFSKYGTAYQRLICPQEVQDRNGSHLSRIV